MPQDPSQSSPGNQTPASEEAKKRAEEQIEHDQDRDPPRTAVPPQTGKSETDRKRGA